MDVDVFRQAFPEFADPERYPVAVVEEFAGLAEGLTSAERFGTLYARAVRLATAHFLTLSAQHRAAGAAGTDPGIGGRVSSKSVGSVSVSYDNSSASDPNGGQWNETRYGRWYMDLASRAGAGGFLL